MNEDVLKYNAAVENPDLKAVCELLAKEINANLPKATNKVWHAAPVWFINDNPIAGYQVTKKGRVNLLFWSGQAFDEPGLTVEGSFKAAEVKYDTPADVDTDKLKKWLQEAAAKQYNYKDIRKNKGKLDLI